ncbi:MAG: flagellar biosynthetic protein FliR [bacterium]|nr:flagellar biosynthetic protein FliR [bacterium]
MFDFINFTAERAQVFLLVITRSSSIFMFAPVLGHRSIPKLVKVSLMILLAGLIVSTMPNIEMEPINSIWPLLGLMFREFLIGAVITVVFLLTFYGVQTAGSIIGYQMGLAMATEFDPSTSAQVSVIGRFWYMLALLIFLVIDGHHLLIQAFADSFHLIPPAGVTMNGEAGEMILRVSAYVFIIALKIAAPVLITLFLTDVALGTIAKTMPTMNVFFVGIPVKIAMGLLVMAISLPAFAYVLEQTMNYLNGELREIYLAMGQA